MIRMAEPITLQTTISLLTLISLTIGVFYYVLTLRNQNRARQIQIIRGINPMVDIFFLSWEFEDYDDIMSKYGPEYNPEGWDNLMRWFRMLEEMGVYVKEGLLDIRLIYLLQGGNITKSWELLKVLLKEHRIRNNHTRWFIEAEYLCKRIIEYGEKHPELKT